MRKYHDVKNGLNLADGEFDFEIVRNGTGLKENDLKDLMFVMEYEVS